MKVIRITAVPQHFWNQTPSLIPISVANHLLNLLFSLLPPPPVGFTYLQSSPNFSHSIYSFFPISHSSRDTTENPQSTPTSEAGRVNLFFTFPSATNTTSQSHPQKAGGHLLRTYPLSPSPVDHQDLHLLFFYPCHYVTPNLAPKLSRLS